MYKSPIEIYTENTLKEIVKQRDGYIFQEVQRIVVDVDKEELLRALKHDRDQYEAGYADGQRDAVVHGRWAWTETGEEDYEQYWVCSKCGEHTYFITNYCPNCGATMDLEVE